MKTILVAVLGCETDQAALDTAYLAGRPFNAHIECLHVRPNPAFPIGSTAYGFPATVVDSRFLASLDEENQARSKEAHIAFVAFCQRWNIRPTGPSSDPNGVTANWRELEGKPLESYIAEGRFYDLVVLGRAGETHELSVAGAGALLLGCGRPLLMAPARAPECVGATVAIAWKNTPEAARALSAANPLLRRAGKILLLTAQEGGDGANDDTSVERIADQLRRSGMEVQTHRVLLAGRELGDAVLGAAGALGADMLVMGGYGHSRIRELVFGGFTRHVLTTSPLPVLLFH